MKVIRRKRFFWLKEKKIYDLLVVCKSYAYVLMFNLLVLKVSVRDKSFVIWIDFRFCTTLNIEECSRTTVLHSYLYHILSKNLWFYRNLIFNHAYLCTAGWGRLDVGFVGSLFFGWIQNIKKKCLAKLCNSFWKRLIWRSCT